MGGGASFLCSLLHLSGSHLASCRHSGAATEGESILGQEVPVLVAGHPGLKQSWLRTRGPAQPCRGPPWLSLWTLGAVPFSEGRPARSCRRGQGWPLLAWDPLRPHTNTCSTVSTLPLALPPVQPPVHTPTGTCTRPPLLDSGTRPPRALFGLNTALPLGGPGTQCGLAAGSGRCAGPRCRGPWGEVRCGGAGVGLTEGWSRCAGAPQTRGKWRPRMWGVEPAGVLMGHEERPGGARRGRLRVLRVAIWGHWRPPGHLCLWDPMSLRPCAVATGGRSSGRPRSREGARHEGGAAGWA